MRVFVAGASGVIGRPLVAQLVAAGHEVTGMTRSRPQAVEEAGATAVVCDALDAGALREAVADAEVVVHQLTALPQRFDPRRKHLYDETNRVRTEGTRNLLAAAGGRRVVCQSIAFAYRPHREPRVLDEDAPLFTDAPPPFGEATRAVVEMERMVLEADGLVLRYGWFYGPGTYYGEGGSTAKDVRAPPLPRRRRRERAVLVRPRRRRGGGHRRRRRARSAGDLQRGRRRAGADARVAAGVRRGDRRAAAAARPALARAADRRQGRRGDVDDTARRVERAGEGRARLAAALAELADRLPRRAALIRRVGGEPRRARARPTGPPR